METVTVNVEQFTPDDVLPVEPEWQADYHDAVSRGREVARQQSVVIVGQARSIGAMLPHTIRRLEEIGNCFRSWSAVIVENDSIDDTKAVLQAWADARRLPRPRPRASAWI